MNSLSGHNVREHYVPIRPADARVCHEYLITLCESLMVHGAPTYRMMECLKISATVLNVEAVFLYLPAHMIISMGDGAMHPTEIKILKRLHVTNLGRLEDTYKVYERVLYDELNTSSASLLLHEIKVEEQPPSLGVSLFIWGFASFTAAPYAFRANWCDLPIAFLLGSLLSFLRFKVAPKTTTFSNMVEISTCVLNSFLARGFSSIKHDGKRLFCFPALAQSGIVLLLPGYQLFSSALELQTSYIIPGIIRLAYAFFYILLLQFGTTIGAVLFGLVHDDVDTMMVCKSRVPAM